MRNGGEGEEDDNSDISLEYDRNMVDVDRFRESIKLTQKELEQMVKVKEKLHDDSVS